MSDRLVHVDCNGAPDECPATGAAVDAYLSRSVFASVSLSARVECTPIDSCCKVPM